MNISHLSEHDLLLATGYLTLAMSSLFKHTHIAEDTTTNGPPPFQQRQEMKMLMKKLSIAQINSAPMAQ